MTRLARAASAATLMLALLPTVAAAAPEREALTARIGIRDLAAIRSGTADRQPGSNGFAPGSGLPQAGLSVSFCLSKALCDVLEHAWNTKPNTSATLPTTRTT